MNILNDQIFVKIKAWRRLVTSERGPFNPFLRLTTKPSTQRRDWQKDGFKMFRNLLHIVLSLLLLIPLSTFAQTSNNFEHPRGLIRIAEVSTLRAKVKKQPYAQVLDQMKQKVLVDAANEQEWSSYQLADAALKSAQIYLLTGEQNWADRSSQYVKKILQDTLYFLNPIGRGLTKADQLQKIMMAYDYCYEAWDLAFRKQFCERTYEAILQVSSNMGFSANYNLPSNWMGVRYGTVLYSALVWDDFDNLNPKKSKARPFIFDGTKRLSDFALANIHPDGWNVESLGYQNYGWSFVFPALIAWQNHFGIALSNLDFYERIIAGQQSWAIAALPIQSGKKVGIKPDFSDDGLSASNRLVPYMLYLAPASLKPYFRWINRSFNTKKSGLQLVDGGFENILFEDLNQKAMLPPKDWLDFTSPGQGTVILRNRFKDERDIVFGFSATSSRKGHQGGDNLSFRLIGLDNIWAIGSGRTNWTGGQTSFFPETPTDSSRFKAVLGKLEKVHFGKNKTIIIGSGSCTGVQRHTRAIQVAFDSIPDKPLATIIIKDVSDNGKIWRLNTPEFNEIKLKEDGFEIIGPNGHRLIGSVKKNKLKNYEITTGQHRYGGNTIEHNYGIPYKNKQYSQSKYIDITCDGSITVELRLK